MLTNPLEGLSAMRPGLADGFIVLIDGGRVRIVADSFAFTNEVRLDAQEEWLYVVETTGKRISRLRVGKDGSLSRREVFGPSSLGAGFPDGIAFDASGNLWIAMVMSDRLIALTPDGKVLELLDDGHPGATALLERHFAAGSLSTQFVTEARGMIAPWMASVTFGGANLRTVCLGSLMGTTIPYFRAPVIDRINALSQRIVESAEFGAKLHELGLVPAGGSPTDFQRFLADDAKGWSKVVSDNGIKAE